MTPPSDANPEPPEEVTPDVPAPDEPTSPEEIPTPQPDPSDEAEEPSDAPTDVEDNATDISPTDPQDTQQPSEPTDTPSEEQTSNPTEEPSSDTSNEEDNQQQQIEESEPTNQTSESSEPPKSPDSLPESTPLLPSPALLVPRVQVDQAGIPNGGIQFFGTKSQPQVIGEDGNLTPPPPEPGSGLPIPPDAITITETFIGQPGGITFNSPDVAVPVEPIEVSVEIPGAQALADAYVALANVGNDMSPITRKKAKKVLVATLVVAVVGRRFK